MLARNQADPAAGGAQHTPGAPALAKLPLSFVPNRGQVDGPARFYAQGPGYSFGFTRQGLALNLERGQRGIALKLGFLDANPTTRLEASSAQPGKVNYIGGSAATSHTGLPTFGVIRYQELWPGIDMVVRGRGGTLKYEFHVRPGADSSDIGLAYSGAQSLALGADGGLRVQTELGALRDKPPVTYQLVDGKRVPVRSNFVMRGDSGYGFALGRHDPALPLIIDPGLVYSTFIGGQAFEQTEIAVDAAGSAYIASGVIFNVWPTTTGAYDTTFGTFADAFITKLNPAGTGLVYSTYLGGEDGQVDHASGLALDSAGHAYVTGLAFSSDFPATPGAYGEDRDRESGATFVTKLSPAGDSLVYSALVAPGRPTNLAPPDIAVDSAGNAVVAAWSFGDDVATPGAFDTTYNGGEDAFVLKLNPAGSDLVYATYVGGARREVPRTVALDAGGNAYITGTTVSADLPTTPGAYQRDFRGTFGDLLLDAAFVTKLNPTGTALDYSTYISRNGGGTVGQALAVGPDGSAYLGGITRASTFPTTAGAYDPTFNPGRSGFVTRLNPTGSGLTYSTFLGGGTSAVADLRLDSGGNAVVFGDFSGSSFPTTPGAYDTNAENSRELFVSKLNSTGSALSYSTYLGGIDPDRATGLALDQAGNAYLAGATEPNDFPTTPGAFDESPDAQAQQPFVSKLDLLPSGFVFGQGTVGGSFSPLSANTKRATPFTLFRNATIRRVYAYIDGKGAPSGQQTLRAVVYRNAGGQPAARAAQSFEFTIGAGAEGRWQPFYLAPPVTLGPGVYWLGLQSGATNGVGRFAWSSRANSRRFNIDAYADGPSDPFGTSTADDQQLSIYAAE